MQRAKRPEVVVEKAVERMKELLPEIERLSALKEEFEDLKASLEVHANDYYEDSSEVAYIGDGLEVDFSPRCLVRKVKDMRGLMQALGKETFLRHVTFPFKELDRLMVRSEQRKFVSFRKTGPRVCRIKSTD
jgi:predicted component of type VI protein secretion system